MFKRFAAALAFTALMFAGIATAAHADTSPPVEFYPNDCAKADKSAPPLASTRHIDAASLSPDGRKATFAQLLAYYCLGAYQRDLATVGNAARAAFDQRMAHARRGEKLAIVLDLDETSLSNDRQILQGGMRFPPSAPNDPCESGGNTCGYVTWEKMGQAKPIAPTLALVRDAVKRHVAVFFVTGRLEDEDMRAATQRNLDTLKYPRATCLLLQPVDAQADQTTWANCKSIARPTNFAPSDPQHPDTRKFKSQVRWAIMAAGYRIILNMGDQKSDLFSPDDTTSGTADMSFLLPNPFY